MYPRAACLRLRLLVLLIALVERVEELHRPTPTTTRRGGALRLLLLLLSAEGESVLLVVGEWWCCAVFAM